jgi:hypothetical protein
MSEDERRWNVCGDTPVDVMQVALAYTTGHDPHEHFTLTGPGTANFFESQRPARLVKNGCLHGGRPCWSTRTWREAVGRGMSTAESVTSKSS